MPNDREAALIAQLQQAVALYQHEDNLTWRKLQQAVYMNAAVITAIGIELFADRRGLLALGAAALTVLFMITIEGSRRYMFARLEAVYAAEQALCDHAGTDRVLHPVKVGPATPATRTTLRVFLGGTLTLWLVLTLAWL